jgi:hypothetical protein
MTFIELFLNRAELVREISRHGLGLMFELNQNYSDHCQINYEKNY